MTKSGDLFMLAAQMPPIALAAARRAAVGRGPVQAGVTRDAAPRWETPSPHAISADAEVPAERTARVIRGARKEVRYARALKRASVRLLPPHPTAGRGAGMAADPTTLGAGARAFAKPHGGLQ